MPTAYPIDDNEWTENPLHLPRREDFVTHPDDPDAQCAWENFGSLNLTQAYACFCKNPHYYQEDFMFMGGRAFAFYFPVIERYLFECEPTFDDDDCQSWILAQGIKLQLQSPTASEVLHLRPRLAALIKYVLSNINKFSTTDEEQTRVRNAWVDLESALNSA